MRQPGGEADVRPEVAADVAGVEHALEMQGVVLTGCAHMNAADQLVAPIHAAGELLAEVALAVLLGPAPARPFSGAWRGDHSAGIASCLIISLSSLFSVCLGAGVMLASTIYLPAARDVAVAVKLPIHGVEDSLDSARLDQSLLERPDRRAIWVPANSVSGPQSAASSADPGV